MAAHRQVSIKDFCQPLPLRSPVSKRSKLDINTSELSFGESEEEPLPESGSDSEQEESVSPDSGHTGQCSSECCADELSEPYHPRIDFALTKRKQGKQSRSFCSSWFKNYKWLSFCTSRQKAFCFYCRSAMSKGLLAWSKKADGAFITKGFDNWKKAKERFQAHEQSQAHQEACFKCRAIKEPSVAAQLASQLQKDQQQRREMFMVEISSLKYVMRQGLAVRGHQEEEGNLYQLLKCRAESIKGLEDWLHDGKYLSHDIINEIIELMAHQLLRQLLNEIRKAEWFSIIADETRDISGGEQLSISLRWVDTSYTVYEDLIGLVEVEQTDAATLAETIKDTLLRSNIQLIQCRGQAYDGASNMAGHLNGVAVRLQREEPRAHYVHCLAHSLNLCLQDCGRSCRCVRDALDLCSDLSNLVRASPKRLALFYSLRDQLAPGAPSLKPLCPTRWTVRTGALDAVLKNYSVICRELEQINEESCGEPSIKAMGLLAVMDRFATFFGLKLSLLVFTVTEQLSTTLQAKDITSQEASRAAVATKSFLHRQRSDTAFASFYHVAVKEAKDFTSEPVLPRQRKPPRRIDQGLPNHQYLSPRDYFRQQYFEVLDLLTEEMTRRFEQQSFAVLHEMERLLIDSCNGTVVQPSVDFKTMYAGDLGFDRLMIQLSMLPDLLRTANEQNHLGIKKVTSIRTVCELFNMCDFAKTMMSEVDRLLRIYLTVPVTSATAERSFSSLRRLKNYLRSTMTQRRLNHVILLHVHKQRTDEIDLYQIARDFSFKNARRKQFFGNF